VSAALAAMECAERAGNPCIGRDRADLVVAGCAILEAMCRLWPVGRLRVADRGVREGILHGLMYEAGRTAGQVDGLPA
jgi:exopolyphosphatase/guanosine-5'-triphosphate,3'-diphosphate pyrophosphatase